MDKALLRPLIFEVLRRTPQTHVHAIENEIRQKAEGYERGDALLVQEAVWDLLLQGVLAPGKNSLNLHLPFVHVTEYGQRCLDEGTIVAHDPDGYAARLRAATGETVSNDVWECARDALLAFHRGLFRASLVLLSRAAFGVLVEVRAAVEKGTSSVPAPTVRANVGMTSLGLAVRTALADHPLPDVPVGEIERELTELEALTHLAHSETGVPLLPNANRESALGRLLLFPAQCRFAYTLIAEVRGIRRTTPS
ncbi:MAG: hypothetical protein NTV92_00010 [Candidatus Bipolaricaulota bacterium]|nr:hypothetical protein [Candidatus Bipolaricaulota bacterium]